MDSEEELLEKIQKLPLQTYHDDQLSSIAEVTEEEDNCLDLDDLSPQGGASFRGGPMANSSSSSGRYYSAEDLLTGNRPFSHPGLSEDGAANGRGKPKHRVHYADTVRTINYLEECDSDGGIYVPNKDVRARVSQERGRRTYPLRDGANRSGDQLRREALLRSQVTSDLVSSGRYHHPAPGADALAGSGAEIDIEYGTEDDEDAASYDCAEVAEQMSPEWWVEGRRGEVPEEPSSHFVSFGSVGPKNAPGPYSRGTGPPEGLQRNPHGLFPRRAKPEHAAKGYSSTDSHATVCSSPLVVWERP